MAGRLHRRVLEIALAAYPAPYRAEYGSEILDVLVESGRATRLSTAFAEAASLTANGLTARARGRHSTRAWADGAAAALVGLAVLLFGVVANAFAALLSDTYWTLHGSPGTPWVDPMWGTFIGWLAAIGALLAGSSLALRLTAWFAVAWAVAIVAVGCWQELGRGGDPLTSLSDIHHVGAGLVFAALAHRANTGSRAREYVFRSRLLIIVAGAWGAHLTATVLIHQPVSPLWAATITALTLLAGFVHWRSTIRGAALVGIAFASVPLARAFDLLGQASANEVVRIAGLIAIVSVVGFMATTAIRVADQRSPDNWRWIRATAALVVDGRRGASVIAHSTTTN